MGATYYFDKKLPAGQTELFPKRQVELFTHGGHLYLRMWPARGKEGGREEYTARLTKANVKDLIAALEDAADYLWSRG